MKMLSLNDRKWKTFVFEDIFIIKRGESLYKQYMKRGDIPYISASAINNGISDYTIIANREANMISLAYDGSIGSTFYQNTPWFASEKIVSLKLKNHKLNRYIALFLCKTINHQKNKYNYAYKWSVGIRMNRGKILLPVNDSGEPDYLFMENYMRQIEEKLLNLYKNYIDCQLQNDFIVPEDKKVWKEFCIEEIFEIKSGVRLTKSNMIEGKIPFVSAADSNNGVTAFVGNKNSSFDKNVLGVNYDGDGGMVISFYHPYDCIFSDSVKRFKLKHLSGNEYIYLLLKSMIFQQRSKYNYNYKFNESRMRKQKIKLPIDKNGEPDWEYMEKFMRAKENLLLKEYFEKKFA